MKHRLLPFLLVVLTCLTLCLPASAAPSSLLILGDSISTGYGLQNDEAGKMQSYGNQLADDFALSGAAYRNLAVNGATSADLLAQLPTISNQIKAADTIVISIGGNDVLGKMLGLLQQATATTSLTAAVEALKSTEMTVIADSFSADAVSSEFAAAIGQFGKNMLEIVAQLEQLNPSAHVFFLTQYNPLNGADEFRPSKGSADESSADLAAGYNALLAFTEQVITGLNDQIKAATEGSAICSAIDVYAAFAGKGGALTRIYEADIHPNQAGHDAIFTLLRDTLDSLPSVPAIAETTAETASTTTSPETTAADALHETTPPAPSSTIAPLPLDDNRNTVPVLIILGVAVLCMGFGLIRMLTGTKRS